MGVVQVSRSGIEPPPLVCITTNVGQGCEYTRRIASTLSHTVGPSIARCSSLRGTSRFSRPDSTSIGKSRMRRDVKIRTFGIPIVISKFLSNLLSPLLYIHDVMKNQYICKLSNEIPRLQQWAIEGTH